MMRQIIDSLLSRAWFYDSFQRAVGSARSGRIYLAECVRPKSGDRILDIGCGTARVLDSLPGVHYVGVDPNPAYIAQARSRYGSHREFYCQPIDRFVVENPRSFDIVMANGVVHHLDDASAASLFSAARLALKPTGRLITYDLCYVPGQSPIARWLISNDRGRYVRNESQYMQLASSCFATVRPTIRHDLLRVPYTHLIMECS